MPTNSPAPSIKIKPLSTYEFGSAPRIPFVAEGQVTTYLMQIGFIRPAFGLAITLIIWVRFGFAAWVMFILALIAIGVVALGSLKLRRVWLTKENVTYRNMFGRRTILSLKEITSAKLFTEFYDPAVGASTRLSIGNAVNKPVISLQGYYWSPKDLYALASALHKEDVKVEVYNDIVSYQDVALLFPENATYLEKHTGRVALIASAAVIVGVVLVSIAITFWW